MRTLRVALVLALGLSLAAAVARADDGWVTGHGEYAIAGGDTAMARERAVKAAERDAVEKKLGAFVVSDSQTKDFQLLKDQVLSTAAGYVTEMQVTSEKQDDGVYVVDIKAHVAQGKIDEDAKARHLALQAMKYPRIAILLAEQHIGQLQPARWWGPQGGGSTPGQVLTVDQRIAENTLIGDWTAQGFSFVDLDALSGKIRAANVVSTNPSADEVRQLSNLMDADVIIFGTSVASKLGNVSQDWGVATGGSAGLISCKASITARVFYADSGEILATSDQTATTMKLSDLDCEREATKLAVEKLSKDLEAKVLAAFNQREMGQGRVRLTVRHIDFAGLRLLEGALRANFRAVEAVDQKSFGHGRADLDLKVDGGDAEGLADEIATKGLGRLKVQVVGVTGNTITLDAQKAKGR